MPTLETRISHLTRRSASSRVFVGTVMTDLSTQARARVGNVGGVISAETSAKAGGVMVAGIEDAIVRGISDALRRLPAEAPQEAIFESAVTRTNEALRRLIDERGLPVDPAGVRGALLARKGRDMVAAVWGDPCLLLYHPTPHGVQTFDLLGDEPAGQTAGFIHLISGCIGREDKLLVSTADLRPIIGEEKLRIIVAGNDPSDAIAGIRRTAADKGDASPVSMFIADVRERTAQPEEAAISATQASIEGLLNTESRTKDILSGSVAASLWRKATAAWTKRKQEQAETGQPAEVETASAVAEGVDSSSEALAEEKEEVTEPKTESREVEALNEKEEIPEKEKETERAPGWMSERGEGAEVAEVEGVAETEKIAGVTERTEGAGATAEMEKVGEVRPAVEEEEAVMSFSRYKRGFRSIIPPTADHPELIIEIFHEIEDESGPQISDSCETPDLWRSLQSAVRQRIDALRGIRTAGTEGPAVETRETAATPAETPAAPRPKPGKKSAALRNFFRRLLGRVRSAFGRISLPEKLKNRLAGLPDGSLVLLVAALTVLAVLNNILAWNNWNRIQQRAAEEFDASVAVIEQKLDAADASIIYRDETRARILLDEAEKMITDLPGHGGERALEKERLNGALETKRNEMRRVVALGVPEVMATIVGSAGEPRLTRIVAADSHIAAVSSEGALFRVALSDGAAQESGKLGGAPAFLAADGGNFVAGSADGKIVLTSPSGKTYDKTADLKETTVADAAYYGSRLYVLDAGRNRIMRFDPTTAGFGAPKFYLKDGTDVSAAVSLAVDGSIWVLNRDGGIVKLLKGSRVDFEMGPIEPAFGAPTEMRLSTSGERLCVLDAAPRRIACFDKKTGLLTAQYASPELEKAEDFVLDDANNALIVASGNRLLRFKLENE